MKFLRGVPEELQDLLQGWLQTHGASPSQVVRGGLYLDLALLLEHRSRIQKLGPIFTYAWGDATSKGGREIYNTRHRFLRQDNAVELARIGSTFACTHRQKMRPPVTPMSWICVAPAQRTCSRIYSCTHKCRSFSGRGEQLCWIR